MERKPGVLRSYREIVATMCLPVVSGDNVLTGLEGDDHLNGGAGERDTLVGKERGKTITHGW